MSNLFNFNGYKKFKFKSLLTWKRVSELTPPWWCPIMGFRRVLFGEPIGGGCILLGFGGWGNSTGSAYVTSSTCGNSLGSVCRLNGVEFYRLNHLSSVCACCMLTDWYLIVVQSTHTRYLDRVNCRPRPCDISCRRSSQWWSQLGVRKLPQQALPLQPSRLCIAHLWHQHESNLDRSPYLASHRSRPSLLKHKIKWEIFNRDLITCRFILKLFHAHCYENCCTKS